MARKFGGVAVALILVVLSGCVHTELTRREFRDASLYIDVRVSPEAQIDASYFLKIDPDDPVGTIVSIGSSVAKAAQVEEAQARMDAAMRRVDLGQVIAGELSDYFRNVEQMRVVDRARAADYRLEIEIWRHGIRANDELGGTFFEVHANSRLRDRTPDTLVWDDFSNVQARIGPGLFGIPSADNVLSAVMLAGLSEAEMEAGITRVARQVAGEIGGNFSRDLQRARRSSR